MGFFDKLKNFITGGGAKVTLQAVEPRLKGPFQVKIHAAVEEADLEIKSAYLKVAGVETVVAKDVEVARRIGDKIEVARQDVQQSNATYDTEIQVAPGQTLKAKSEYDWETAVMLPDNSLPSFRGVNSKHEWKILAGLEVAGNDPDSGWIVLDLR